MKVVDVSTTSQHVDGRLDVLNLLDKALPCSLLEVETKFGYLQVPGDPFSHVNPNLTLVFADLYLDVIAQIK